jgi:hypothetical protein
MMKNRKKIIESPKLKLFLQLILIKKTITSKKIYKVLIRIKRKRSFFIKIKKIIETSLLKIYFQNFSIMKGEEEVKTKREEEVAKVKYFQNGQMIKITVHQILN